MAQRCVRQSMFISMLLGGRLPIGGLRKQTSYGNADTVETGRILTNYLNKLTTERFCRYLGR